MELGAKLRQARLEAGLSQKALCGDVITRNMLSQIEKGSAHPSMKTLQYLASQLGRPVSFFLEDGMEASPNQTRILTARRCFDEGDWNGTVQALQEFKIPDEVFGREYSLLWALSCLNLAEEAVDSRRIPYARELLEKAVGVVPYCAEEIRRKYLLLRGRLGEKVSGKLPSLDGELLLRAEEALMEGNYDRSLALLEAAEGRSPRWHLRKGQIFFVQKAYREAAAELQLAEETYPKETIPQLEITFRELGDFEKAYGYAIKARNHDSSTG